VMVYCCSVCWGSCTDYLNDWGKVIEDNPNLNIHILSYENLHKNSVAELGRLSRFLGKDHDDVFLKSVVEACTIDKQRARKAKFWEGVTHLGSRLMYREGKTGGWRQAYTVAMNEAFDHYWAESFKGSTVFNFQY